MLERLLGKEKTDRVKKGMVGRIYSKSQLPKADMVIANLLAK